MKLYSLTEQQFTEELNKVKDILAKDLCYAGVISEDQSRQMEEDFAVILAPSAMLGSKVKKALGWEDGQTYFKTIKLNLKDNNKEKEDVHQSENSDPEGVDNGSD